MIDRTLVIPDFCAGQVNRVQESRDRPGGKGVNVAVALADYGKSVAVSGFLGKANAACFEALFEEKRIADYFVRTQGSTRTGLKIVDPVCHQTTDINFPGLVPAPADFNALLRQIEDLARGDAGWFVLSGSLPPGVPAAAYQDLILLLKGRGKKVLLDSSGEPLRLGLEAAPCAIKPEPARVGMAGGRTSQNERGCAGSRAGVIGAGHPTGRHFDGRGRSAFCHG